MHIGKSNIVTGFLFSTLFMLYGCVLICWRDFTFSKALRIADCGIAVHLKSRLARAQGTLFARRNIAVGLMPMRFPRPYGSGGWISVLADAVWRIGRTQ